MHCEVYVDREVQCGKQGIGLYTYVKTGKKYCLCEEHRRIHYHELIRLGHGLNKSRFYGDQLHSMPGPAFDYLDSPGGCDVEGCEEEGWRMFNYYFYNKGLPKTARVCKKHIEPVASLPPKRISGFAKYQDNKIVLNKAPTTEELDAALDILCHKYGKRKALRKVDVGCWGIVSAPGRKGYVGIREYCNPEEADSWAHFAYDYLGSRDADHDIPVKLPFGKWIEWEKLQEILTT